MGASASQAALDMSSSGAPLPVELSQLQQQLKRFSPLRDITRQLSPAFPVSSTPALPVRR